ncbi:MAG: L-seryl-tRNA(Sec) selenium transferase [Thermoguttaceae bacterium]|jgi:L-seryl-tRNA(Ser) seleniumtransferase
MSSTQDRLRSIPSVEALLQDGQLARAAADVPRKIVVECVRGAVEEARAALVGDAGPQPADAALRRQILDSALDAIRDAAGPCYRRVINATGVILHTALGRAALPARAIRQITDELSGYSLLQADLATGRRAKRDARIQWLFQQLTGAEAATVVNNNAAATWIALSTVAAGKEVIVSRGQLVEIGGSFRLPDVMAASGARMIEVGTTNKTHARDYRQAITPQTAAILRVHPSNYKITGFTSEVPLEELAGIAHEHGLVLIDDVGAGALVDLAAFGLDAGPLLAGSIRGGADLVLSSTDKLIGGPQGGVILGRADLVEAVRKNPLARIVRVGKLTLAALEATLGLFFDEEQALHEVPTLRMVCRRLADIDEQARRIAEAIGRAAGDCPDFRGHPGTMRSMVGHGRENGTVPFTVAVVDGVSQMGGGSLPGQDLPTRLVAVHAAGIGPDELAARLRRGRPSVFARIHDNQLLLDPRTLLDGEEGPLAAAVMAALKLEVKVEGC